MSTSGTEKYNRILLTIIKGGTKLTRRLFEKRVKDLSDNGNEDTIDEFLTKHKTDILQNKSGNGKENIYFPQSGETNLEKWDISMFCYVLLETCELTSILTMHVKELQKIRNKLCHVNDPSLETSKYDIFKEKIRLVFESCVTEINDKEFKKEMNTLVESLASGPLSLDETLKAMHTFFRMEFEQRKILEKISSGQDSTNEKLDRALGKLVDIDSRLPPNTCVNVQGMGIVIEVRNCSEEKEKEVLDILVKTFNDAINKKESGFDEDLPNGSLHAIRETVAEVFKDFLKMGRDIISVEQKCVLITIKCTSIQSFVNLIKDYRSDALSVQLSGIETAIKSLGGCENVQLETFIFKDEFMNVLEDTVSKLDEQVQPNAIIPFNPQSVMPVGRHDVSATHEPIRDSQQSSSTKEKSVRLTIKCATMSHRKTIHEFIKTRTFQSGMKRIQSEIGQQLNIENMSLAVELPRENGASNINTVTSEEVNPNMDGVKYELQAHDEEPHQLKYQTVHDEDESPCKVEAASVVVEEASILEENLGQHSQVHDSDIKQETKILQLGATPLHSINKLIGDSKLAMINGNKEMAKELAIKASTSVDIEKQHLLRETKPLLDLEGQLSDWYWQCYSLLYVVEEIDRATICYYKATVFGPNWDYDDHLSASEMLWDRMFFKSLTKDIKLSKDLLRELDGLAKYAEDRNKWSLCVTIDNDIETIYYFLGILNFLKMRPYDINKKQDRLNALKRMSRCYLKMGLHHDVIKSCNKIKVETGEHPDTTTLEIWAQSLFQTKCYEAAFIKSSLALKYCENDASRKRLYKLQEDIKRKRKLPDETWLTGTHAFLLPSPCHQQSQEKSKTNKRSRPKRKPPIGAEQYPSQSGFTKSNKTESGVDNETDITTESHELKSVPETDLRDKEFLDSESDSSNDSDEQEDINSDTIDTNEDQMSYNEQSLHNKHCVATEVYLQDGINLGVNYLDKFKSNRKKSYKQPFYTELLDKDALRKLLAQDPKRFTIGIIYLDSTHEAHCIPLQSDQQISVIEISGRSKIGCEIFHEDEVVIELLDNSESCGKRYGKVIGVLNRRRHENVKHPVFLCTFDENESHLVRPLCKTVPKIHILTREISKVSKTQREKANKLELYQYDEKEGCLNISEILHINPADKQLYVLLVAYIHWDIGHYYPRGAVIGILPRVENVSTGLKLLNLQYKIPGVYATGTVEATEKCTQTYETELKDLLKCRMDLTDINTFSINEQDKVDLNYTFSIAEIENGYKIGVHVSDVSSFVQKDTDLDKEALRRSTTFDSCFGQQSYMLPEYLSKDLLSLLPGRERPTISLFLLVTNKGMPIPMKGNTNEVVLSYIKSKRKLSYEDVDGILSSENTDDELENDVRNLVRISLKMKASREKYPIDATCIAYDEAFGFRQSRSDTLKGKIMTDEILEVANRKITQYLQAKYGDCIPLMFTEPSSDEAVQGFLKKAGHILDLVIRLQNKRIGPKIPKYDACKSKNLNVILCRNVWETIKELPKQVGRYIQNDDLHPLQRITFSNLQSILNSAEYKPRGSLKDVSTSTLKTRYTSPISSFIDMVVLRQLHSALVDKKNPYTLQEIKSICAHANSMRKKEKEFKQACKLLKIASELQEAPMMIKAVVSKISGKGLSLLTNIPNQEIELPFSLLDVAEKPVVFTDEHKFPTKVTVTWKKRLYNFHIREKNDDERGILDLEINPNKDIVFIPLAKWAKMLKHSDEGNEEALCQEIKGTKELKKSGGQDDVSTECINLLELKPNTKFSMTFTCGQIVNIQITSEHHRGMLKPKLMLYNMTNNVRFCLQHQDDPVLNLHEYAIHATRDQYEDVKEYLKIWEPIMLMESSIGAVKNEENFSINDVPVKFNGKNGKFRLGLAECEARNIEFSGTLSDDDEDDEEESTERSCYDWLCIKTDMTNNSKTTSTGSLHLLNPLWVGHAKITEVRRRKVYLTVKFSLHERAPLLPKAISSEQKNCSVEVLRKMEVHRRSENFIKSLQTEHETLAAKIALRKAMPDLDENRKGIADSVGYDLFYEASTEDLRQKPMPRNNKNQGEAIEKALKSTFSLIQGPPGTGKSITGIKLIYLFDRINEQIHHEERKSRKQVLFCGPSNKSVDLVAVWMLNKMGNRRPNFVRVYGRSIETVDFPIPGRTFQSKRSTRTQRTSPFLYQVALHHLIRENGKKHADEIKKMDKMFKNTNYAPMPLQVKKYVSLIREASIEEIRKHDVILCTTAVGSNPKVLSAANVYQVIVDEAGMCPEPQCLVPIIATKAEQVVLIGDHKQLKPIVMCKEAASLGLDTSLFERYASEISKDASNVEYTMLEEQYRMHPNLCEFPSSEFYQNKLKNKDGMWIGKGFSFWPREGSKTYPFVLVHVEGHEEILPVSTEEGNEQSRSNADEVERVVSAYFYLKNKLEQNEDQHKPSIKILSQYNSQCSEIRKKNGIFNDENVGTVVSSQGGEWDYVIFSTVRSLPDYKIEKNPTIGWCQQNLGFITDKNQVNVALTRARKGLIIIGNRKLLECDAVWKKLVQHYEKHGCLMDPDQFEPTQIRNKQTGYEFNTGGVFKESTTYIGSSVRPTTSRWRQPRDY